MKLYSAQFSLHYNITESTCGQFITPLSQRNPQTSYFPPHVNRVTRSYDVERLTEQKITSIFGFPTITKSRARSIIFFYTIASCSSRLQRVKCLLQLAVDVFSNVERQVARKIESCNSSLLCAIAAGPKSCEISFKEGMLHAATYLYLVS